MNAPKPLVQMRCNWTFRAIDDLHAHTGLYRMDPALHDETQEAVDRCVVIARERGSNLVSRADVRAALGKRGVR